MPIKPENRDKYPRDWADIRRAILERADYKCEGSPAFPGCRAEDGYEHPVTGSRVVITIAHMDHGLDDHSPENLRALCQRCHLRHDQEGRNMDKNPILKAAKRQKG